MISRNDCYLLLGSLKDSGVDVQQQVQLLARTQTVPISVIKFINEKRQLDLTTFYQKIRKSYNQKHSKLYGNIVKDTTDITKVLTTLSGLLTQILLYSKGLENTEMFLRHSRAQEISEVLVLYFKNYDITTAMKLLQLVKADIKALESIQLDTP